MAVFRVQPLPVQPLCSGGNRCPATSVLTSWGCPQSHSQMPDTGTTSPGRCSSFTAWQFPAPACGSSHTKHTLRMSMRPLRPHEPPHTGPAPLPRQAMKGAGGQ